jgi:hypothetical protein
VLHSPENSALTACSNKENRSAGVNDNPRRLLAHDGAVLHWKGQLGAARCRRTERIIDNLRAQAHICLPLHSVFLIGDTY